MKKTFNFGKIDYDGKGRKDNLVSIEIELKEKEEGKPVFSACGAIWNRAKTDWISGGQNLDTIKKYINDPTFKKIYTFWKKYHLNDMHPECIHQHELGWEEIAKEKIDGKAKGWLYESQGGILGKPCPVCGYKYGSAWIYHPIPENDLQEIKKLFEINI